MGQHMERLVKQQTSLSTDAVSDNRESLISKRMRSASPRGARSFIGNRVPSLVTPVTLGRHCEFSAADSWYFGDERVAKGAVNRATSADGVGSRARWWSRHGAPPPRMESADLVSNEPQQAQDFANDDVPIGADIAAGSLRWRP